MNKSADAFRTISEVADWLGVQTHVLRFWESKFSQVRPVKRAGGRRYYRPADMLLLGGIRRLLHDDGMTIKGVQKILREEGVAFVSDLSQPLDALTAAEIDEEVSPQTSFVAAKRTRRAPPAETAQPELPLAPPQPPIVAEPVEEGVAASTRIAVGDDLKPGLDPSTDVTPPAPTLPSEDAPHHPDVDAPEPLEHAQAAPDEPERTADTAGTPEKPVTIIAEPVEEPPIEDAVLEDMAPEPEPEPEPDPQSAAPVANDAVAAPEEESPPAPPIRRPHVVDAPDGPPHSEIPVGAGVLSRLASRPKPGSRSALPELRTRLAALRDRIAQADPPAK